VAQLTTELDLMRTSRDVAARDKAALERQLDRVRTDAAAAATATGGDGAGWEDGGRAVLAEQKKRLEAEVQRLQERLDRETAARTNFEMRHAQSMGSPTTSGAP
jgi:hypothetical protein